MTDPYAIRKEDLPKIFEEYDKLAKIMVEREKKRTRALHFFHFMIDLEGGPCVSKTSVGMWIGNRISGSDSVGRFVSMSSICRTGRIPYGKCGRRYYAYGDCG